MQQPIPTPTRDHIGPRPNCTTTGAIHVTPTTAEVSDFRTPQAGDRLDATGQVLRVGDEVSFHATSYTTGGIGTVKRFTATFVIIRRNNGGDIRRAPSNVTRLHAPTY